MKDPVQKIIDQMNTNTDIVLKDNYTRKQRRNRNRGCRGKGKKIQEIKCFICHDTVPVHESVYMGKLKDRDPKTGVVGREKRSVYTCKLNRYIPRKDFPAGNGRTFHSYIPAHYKSCESSYKSRRLPRNDFEYAKELTDAFDTCMKLKKYNYNNSTIHHKNDPKIIEIWDKEKQQKKEIAIHPQLFRDHYRKRKGDNKDYEWWAPPFNYETGKSNGKSKKFNTRNQIYIRDTYGKSFEMIQPLFRRFIPGKCRDRWYGMKTYVYFNLYHELPDPKKKSDKI